jgi:tripartite-type tricarboxylate transporter receptor subunit TctC
MSMIALRRREALRLGLVRLGGVVAIGKVGAKEGVNAIGSLTRNTGFLGSALSAAVLPSTLLAQTSTSSAWPSKPIRLIVPVGPGGGVDLVGRLIAEQLAKILGQSIFVENIGGGGGSIGSLATARAAPDGHTLMVGYVGTHGTNPALRKLNYDALTDFSPIAMVGGTPNVLVVSSSFPAKDFKQFAATFSSDGDKLSYASSKAR